MTKTRSLLEEYGLYHQDARNRLCHEIGVPLIIIGVFSLLSLVQVGPAELGTLVGLAVILFYATINLRMALIAGVAFLVMHALGALLTWPWALAVFAIGWALQLAGHRFEGKSPAFLHNAMHLLIGPLWITIRLFAAR